MKMDSFVFKLDHKVHHSVTVSRGFAVKDKKSNTLFSKLYKHMNWYKLTHILLIVMEFLHRQDVFFK